MAKKRLPPWGDLLGGMPIERLFPRDHPEFAGWAEKDAIAERYRRMLRVKEQHYHIEDRTGWRPWYDLAVALAAELDDALKIVNSPPRPKGKLWRDGAGGLGVDSLRLLQEVAIVREALRRENPGTPISQDAALAELCERFSHYHGTSRETLKTRYLEAERIRRVGSKSKSRRTRTGTKRRAK